MGACCGGNRNQQNQPQCCQPLPQGQAPPPMGPPQAQPQFIAVPLPQQQSQPMPPPPPAGPQIAPFAFQVQLQPRTC
jgi:hypothetical protein